MKRAHYVYVLLAAMGILLFTGCRTSTEQKSGFSFDANGDTVFISYIYNSLPDGISFTTDHATYPVHHTWLRAVLANETDDLIFSIAYEGYTHVVMQTENKWVPLTIVPSGQPTVQGTLSWQMNPSHFPFPSGHYHTFVIPSGLYSTGVYRIVLTNVNIQLTTVPSEKEVPSVLWQGSLWVEFTVDNDIESILQERFHYRDF